MNFLLQTYRFIRYPLFFACCKQLYTGLEEVSMNFLTPLNGPGEPPALAGAENRRGRHRSQEAPKVAVAPTRFFNGTALHSEDNLS